MCNQNFRLKWNTISFIKNLFHDTKIPLLNLVDHLKVSLSWNKKRDGDKLIVCPKNCTQIIYLG